MKRAMRNLLFSLGILFSGLSLVVLFLSAPQISKNRLDLLDMRACIEAVKGFQKERHRLPGGEEFRILSASLPSRNEYWLATTPEECAIQMPGGWKAGGWAMWYWRGEWNEYYSSWNDFYSLTDQASWWGFCGFLLFLPILALLFLAAAFIPFLRR
jgi:hypothetical protein